MKQIMKEITLSFATLGLLAFALCADEEGRAVLNASSRPVSRRAATYGTIRGMKNLTVLLGAAIVAGIVSLNIGCAKQPAPLCVSGVYPHLAMTNGEGECGTGATPPQGSGGGQP